MKRTKSSSLLFFLIYFGLVACDNERRTLKGSPANGQVVNHQGPDLKADPKSNSDPKSKQKSEHDASELNSGNAEENNENNSNQSNHSNDTNSEISNNQNDNQNDNKVGGDGANSDIADTDTLASPKVGNNSASRQQEKGSVNCEGTVSVDGRNLPLNSIIASNPVNLLSDNADKESELTLTANLNSQNNIVIQGSFKGSRNGSDGRDVKFKIQAMQGFGAVTLDYLNSQRIQLHLSCFNGNGASNSRPSNGAIACHGGRVVEGQSVVITAQVHGSKNKNSRGGGGPEREIELKESGVKKKIRDFKAAMSNLSTHPTIQIILGNSQEEVLTLKYGLGAMGSAEFQAESGIVRKLSCDLSDRLNGKAILEATSTSRPQSSLETDELN